MHEAPEEGLIATGAGEKLLMLNQLLAGRVRS